MPHSGSQLESINENPANMPFALGRMAAEWFRLGCAAAKNSQPQHAMQMFEYALRVDPRFVQASNRRGKVLLEQQLRTDAETSFRYSLHLDPDNEYALLMLGCMHAETRDYEAARSYFEHVVRANNESHLGWKNLARVYDRLGCFTRSTLAHMEKNRIEGSGGARVPDRVHPHAS